MEQRFKYKRDKQTKRLTWISAIVIAAIFVAFILLLGDGYLRAWIIFTLFAILILYILSIPRYIKVDEKALEIHCVVEMTRILIEDIQSVRKVTHKERSPLILLLGSYGFFGYYGYYIDFRRWEIVKAYTTERENLIEIEDIYEDIYLVSCREADRLIEMVMQAKLIQAGDEARTPREE